MPTNNRSRIWSSLTRANFGQIPPQIPPASGTGYEIWRARVSNFSLVQNTYQISP